MKITIENYNSNWVNLFNDCKTELTIHLKNFTPIIEHIGSTSIEGIAAKPIIDILVGIPSTEILDKIPNKFPIGKYIYFEKYNSIMPYRRFFVQLRNKNDSSRFPMIYTDTDEVPNELHELKLAHIHVLEYNSFHWVRHIAFRDYVRSHSNIAKAYQQLKEELSQRDWMDGIEYNDAKNEFIKKIEAEAIEWYKSKK